MLSHLYYSQTVPIEKWTIRNDGALMAPVTVTSVGVADYDGVKKYKDPNELFSKETLDSLRGLVVTNEHPPEFINPDNYKTFDKGDFSEPYVTEDGKIKGTIVIRDRDSIKDVMTGNKKFVSLGYYKKDDPTPGMANGQSYDVVQRNIIANHLALTSSPRLGSDMRVEVDSNGKIILGENKMSKKWIVEADGKNVSDQTLTLRLKDGTDIQVDSDIHKEITAYKDEVKTKEKELAEKKAEIDSLTKKETEKKTEIDSKTENLKIRYEAEQAKSKALQSEIDSLKSSYKDDVKKAAQELIEVEKKAEIFGVETDSKDVEQIKKEVISASTLDIDGTALDSTEKIDAYFDAACVLHKKEKKEAATVETDSDDSRIKALRDAGVEIV